MCAKRHNSFNLVKVLNFRAIFTMGRNTSKTRLPVVNKNIVTQSQIIAGDPFSVNKRCDSKLMLDLYVDCKSKDYLPLQS